MRILVTGGSGFLGRSLARALIERGEEVRILDTNVAPAGPGAESGAEVLEGSVTDRETVWRALEGCRPYLTMSEDGP